MLSSQNLNGAESLSLVHRKQFLKARYVSFLRYISDTRCYSDSSVSPDVTVTPENTKDWKLFDKDGRKFYYTNDCKNDSFKNWDTSYTEGYVPHYHHTHTA